MSDLRAPDEILELAFEREGDGFLFYRNRWAAGIAVTAEERQAFLSAGIWDRVKWVRAVRRRPSAGPPRDGKAISRQIFRAMPRGMGVMCLVIAALCIAAAWGDDMSAWQRAAVIIVALFFAYGGIANIAARR